jgi:hypothetical protein
VSAVVGALRKVNTALDGEDADATLDALLSDCLKLNALDDAGAPQYHTNLKAAKTSRARDVSSRSHACLHIYWLHEVFACPCRATLRAIISFLVRLRWLSSLPLTLYLQRQLTRDELQEVILETNAIAEEQARRMPMHVNCRHMP